MHESFYELLKKRRAVRSYTGERVPRDVLERIARAARRGPNAGYSQGLRILVVDDPRRSRRSSPTTPTRSRARGSRKAAAHFFVLTREQDYHDRYTQPDKLAVTGGVEVVWPVPFWHVDAGAAMMLVMLAALEEGLGAGVYGVPVEDDARVRELLAHPGGPHDRRRSHGRPPGRGSRLGARVERLLAAPPAHGDVVRWNRWSPVAAAWPFMRTERV